MGRAAAVRPAAHRVVSQAPNTRSSRSGTYGGRPCCSKVQASRPCRNTKDRHTERKRWSGRGGEEGVRGKDDPFTLRLHKKLGVVLFQRMLA